MSTFRPDKRTDDGQLIHPLSQPRHVLAHIDSRDIRMNRRELASVFNRCRRFQVHHILMRRSTRQEDHDDGFVLLSRCRVFRLQQLRQRDSAKPERSDFQKRASGNTIAVIRCRTLNRQHARIRIVVNRADEVHKLSAEWSSNTSPLLEKPSRSAERLQILLHALHDCEGIGTDRHKTKAEINMLLLKPRFCQDAGCFAVCLA